MQMRIPKCYNVVRSDENAQKCHQNGILGIKENVNRPKFLQNDRQTSNFSIYSRNFIPLKSESETFVKN